MARTPPLARVAVTAKSRCQTRTRKRHELSTIPAQGNFSSVRHRDGTRSQAPRTTEGDRLLPGRDLGRACAAGLRAGELRPRAEEPPRRAQPRVARPAAPAALAH